MKEIPVLKIWGERELIISIKISLIWLSYFYIYFLQIFVIHAIILVLEPKKMETALFICFLGMIMLHVYRLLSNECGIGNALCHSRSSNKTLTVIIESALQVEHKL